MSQSTYLGTYDSIMCMYPAFTLSVGNSGKYRYFGPPIQTGDGGGEVIRSLGWLYSYLGKP